MPRVARVKNSAGIYHIMIRSISDVLLFKDELDKIKYLHLIKKYQEIFRFKVYAYCLLTNHGHIAIDCCGADISKIMKSINQCYVAYYNKKYDRHGHLFQDRFKSKLVNCQKYLIALSAYIHNNPKDIDGFNNNVENYPFSSLGVYLGIVNDTFEILDSDYVLGHFSTNKSRSRKSYLKFIKTLSETNEKMDVEFENEGFESRSERKILIRNFTPEHIIKFVSKYTGNSFNMHVKFNHKNSELKSLCIIIMRCLCNYSLKEVCDTLGNITSSNIYYLSEKGYKLITENEKYITIIDDLIKEHSVA